MTQDKDFKALVRERMTETGESYATARANLLGTPGQGSIEPRRFAIPDWPMTGRLARRRPGSIPDEPVRYVEVTADEVAVHAGSGTEFHLPRELIVDARRCDGFLGAFRGVFRPRSHTAVLLGGGGTVVAIRLDREINIQVADEPSTLREVRVAVDDADGLVALLH